MPAPLYTVDAFTRIAFTGNPAAVCLPDEAPEERWMQDVAAEMNLSETAFCWPKDDGGEDVWRLRWFTPTTEVELCGHATLATVHVLLEEGHLDEDAEVTFHTKSGHLTCRREDEERISMDFPSHPPYAVEGILEDVTDAIGTEPLWIGENGLDRFALLEDEKAVRSLEPDLDRVAQIGGRGLIVTAEADDDASDVDFVSRFFAPAYGVDEDPVTGSAHCSLGPYWANKLDEDTVVGRQVSDRGGTVHVTVTDQGVRLAGHAVRVAEGELVL